MIKFSTLLYLCIPVICVIALSKTYSTYSSPPIKKEAKRLLVNIEPNTPFTPEEFARAASMPLVHTEERNPYKALQNYYLQEDLVVLDTAIDQERLPGLASAFGYRYLSFKEESLEEALEQSQKLLQSIPKKSSEFAKVSKEDTQEMYTLLGKVDKIFTRNHLHYFAIAGTLLGAVRHGEIIPWDDDIDLAILDVNEKKFLALKKDLDNAGLSLWISNNNFYKISSKKGHIIKKGPLPASPIHAELLRGAEGPNPEEYPYHYPFVDIFILKLEHSHEFQDVYVHKSPLFYSTFPKERFYYEYVRKTKRVPFGPIELEIPEHAEEVLRESFGTPDHPDLWKTYALESGWNHKIEKKEPIQGAALVPIDEFPSSQSWY